MAIGERFKSINAPTLKSNSAIKKTKGSTTRRKPAAKTTTRKPAAKKTTTRKPAVKKTLTAAEKRKQTERNKVTAGRRKKAVGTKAKKTLKERYAERVAKHSQRMTDLKEANTKRIAAYEKRHKVQNENQAKKQKAQLANINKRFSIKMAALKKAKPKLKGNKIIAPKMVLKEFKKAVPKLKKLPSTRITKGAVKKRGKRSAGAGKAAAKTRAKNAKSGKAKA